MKMEDIARLAGVSKAAVSLALNGKGGIGPETRDRILQIARENGYQPKSRTAVREPQSASITFLVFANSGIVLEQYYQQPFFRELIHFIEERCRASGYSLLFASVDMSAFDEGIRAIAEDKRADGVILLGTNLNKAMLEQVADRLNAPLVVLDTCFETLPIPFIQINNAMGAYQAGQHLCGLGHRDIGYIASDIRIRNFDDRRAGFMQALQENGRELSPEHVFSVAPTILASQDALKKRLSDYRDSRRPMPTAFFCECDYIAISAIKSLVELGYRVPEDVSVVGFDNISEALIVSPELTTVHVEKERMARLAVDMIVEAIESDSLVGSKVIVDTQFIARGSSRSPDPAALEATASSDAVR
ncbi:transcriptional regulator, LacI family [Cohnella sp. OV330]|uniref:LacI family DNA-binding transcriptional regulator n=1 Tax=Cohnella sp. OV330 TaxID=1855288 RepID=UPI0008E8F699|nr:LacI family DNA-binding transcriptional regulator [Cohnella sp. OV330]SFA82258.1 transcriptional regulator, LacI family [Cohnella sp. OV330]